jgi:Spy/CpxP family protein refolding chaperone
MEEAKDQIHSDFVAGVKTIFTAEQYAKFDAPQTEDGMKEGAKWRAIKMQKKLGLSEEQRASLYDLIVSTTQQQNELKTSAKDKTALYEGRIKLDDEYYAKVKTILTEEQFAKFNSNDF